MHMKVHAGLKTVFFLFLRDPAVLLLLLLLLLWCVQESRKEYMQCTIIIGNPGAKWFENEFAF